MKTIIFSLILITTACSNTVPQIRSLGLGNKDGGGNTPTSPAPSFTSPNSPGASEVVATSGDYTGKIVIHSGTEGQHKTSPGGYKLEIRSLSL